MLNIGFSEAVVIFVVALIVLGPERLPEVGKYLAKLSIEMKKSIDEIKKELQLDEVEKELNEVKEELEKIKEEAVKAPLEDATEDLRQLTLLTTKGEKLPESDKPTQSLTESTEDGKDKLS